MVKQIIQGTLKNVEDQMCSIFVVLQTKKVYHVSFTIIKYYQGRKNKLGHARLQLNLKTLMIKKVKRKIEKNYIIPHLE